jgi:pimeloyl-ACP methyl ester carboxylesterase
VLTNFGTFEPGSPEQAMEDWITASGGDPVALARVLGTFVDTPLADLARITVPTLVLAGAGDGHNETAEALAHALADGHYLMLPGDHGTAFHAPEFETAVTGFLDEGAARAPRAGGVSSAGRLVEEGEGDRGEQR